MKNIQLNQEKSKSYILVTLIALIITTIIATTVLAQSDITRPTILTVIPENNAKTIPNTQTIIIEFSEDINPTTINANTISVIQRTTPKEGDYRYINLAGTITYQNKIATFTPNTPLAPSQEFGNVFTVTATTEIKDKAGNELAQNYKWSFTTGNSEFYTGASTSQLDQTDTNPISQQTTAQSPQTQTIAPAPISTTPLITKNNPTSTKWAWIIGGIVVLFLAILAIVIATKPTGYTNMNKKTDNQDNNTFEIHTFGTSQPINKIEGIGEEYTDLLHQIGIKTTKQLWEANANDVSNQTGISKKLITSWQHMAELMSITDIGPQYAELLERSGVHSIEQLQNYDATTLQKIITKKQNSLNINITGNAPGYTTIQHWIDSARDSTKAYNQHSRM